MLAEIYRTLFIPGIFASGKLQYDAAKAPDVGVTADSCSLIHHFGCGPVDVGSLGIGPAVLLDLAKVCNFAQPVLRHENVGRSQRTVSDLVCVEVLNALEYAFHLERRGNFAYFSSIGLPRLDPLVKSDGRLVLLRDLEGVS